MLQNLQKMSKNESSSVFNVRFAQCLKYKTYLLVVTFCERSFTFQHRIKTAQNLEQNPATCLDFSLLQNMGGK